MVPTKTAMQKKKIKRKKSKKNWSLLLLNLFREGAHMGKIRLLKKIETEKTGGEMLKELFYTTQMAHCKISKSSNSNNRNNNSYFRGSGLAGPPVTYL